MCKTLISLDLLGRWGCMVRGVHTAPCTCTWAAPLEAWARWRAYQQDDCCPLIQHKLHGELGLLPSHPTATHQGWPCRMLLAHTCSIPSLYCVAGICALGLCWQSVCRPVSLLLLHAEAGRGGSAPAFALMRVLERQGAIFSFESVLGYNFS